MTSIYYDSPLGSSSASTGLNDFLLVSTLSYHNSLGSYKDKYFPYYIEHTSLTEWEYGLGIVIDNLGQDVLIRGGNILYPLATIYSSSNSNNKVNFSSGTKNVKSIISPERVIHGGNNYSYKTSNFIADTVQTVYGIAATGSTVSANLPLASGNKNLILGFKLLESSSYNLNILPSGSDTIDGESSTTLTIQEQYTSLISDGSNWYELVPLIDVSGAGLPSGSIGSIQFKASSTFFDGTDALFWESTSGNLLLGDKTVSTASIILPSSSGQNIIFNNQLYNNDFIVKGTGNNQLFFDASTGRLGLNTSSPSTILHIIGKCANDTLRVESSTECATGVAITLFHNPNTGSQTGDYPATINMAGRNSAAQQINYAQIRSKVLGTVLNNTSGELLFNVDHTGVSKNIATFNIGAINLGLDARSLQNSNNIILGQLSKDSGSNNIIVGHSGLIGGLLSNKNILIGNYGVLRGSNNLVLGHNANISGSYIYTIGNNSNIDSDYTFNFGEDNTINGGSNFVLGSGNSVQAIDSYIIGNSNTNNDTKTFIIGENIVSSNTSGYIVGFNNNISGLLNIINGNSIYSTGNNNTVVGQYNIITGSNNDILGDSNIVSGSGNTIFGDSISATGSGCLILGKNITSSDNSKIIIGNNSQDLVISSGSLVYNTGLYNSSFIIYGSGGSTTGVFYQNNLLGLNKIPNNGYLLDINGNIRSTGIYTDNFRFGTSSTSGSVLVSDVSGNASWTQLSTIQSALVSGLIDDALIIKTSNAFNSTSGLYWSSTSGLYLSPGNINSSFFIGSTGNSPILINNNNTLNSNVFNIKGSGSNDLLIVDAANNRIGVNITPSHNMHVSGTTKIQTSTFDYIQKEANKFIISYDVNGSTFKNWSITSSGMFLKQTNAGSLIPIQTFGSSTPTDVTNVYNLMLVYDPAELIYQIKFTSGIYGGFTTFTGTSDT